MPRTCLVALLFALSGTASSAEESLVLSVVGAGQAGPDKLCAIYTEGGVFWAAEQIATNSLPAPKVSLEPVEGREKQFSEVFDMLSAELTDLPEWKESPPEAPFLHLALVPDPASGKMRRDLYRPGLAVPPQVQGLFGDLGRYGMECLPPVLR